MTLYKLIKNAIGILISHETGFVTGLLLEVHYRLE